MLYHVVCDYVIRSFKIIFFNPSPFVIYTYIYKVGFNLYGVNL